MSDKFGHDSLVMRLAERLRADDVKAGAVLPSESALMAELGVGRQQLREALGVLEAFGAVNSRQGARRRWVGADLGSLVASSAELTGEPRTTVAELLVVRQALETSLLAKVMPLHTAASRAEIRELAHEMEERAAQGRSFAELDQQFHLSLFAPLRNSTLEGILGAFWTLLEIIEGPSRSTSPTRRGSAPPCARSPTTAARSPSWSTTRASTRSRARRRRSPAPSRTSRWRSSARSSR